MDKTEMLLSYDFNFDDFPGNVLHCVALIFSSMLMNFKSVACAIQILQSSSALSIRMSILWLYMDFTLLA